MIDILSNLICEALNDECVGHCNLPSTCTKCKAAAQHLINNRVYAVPVIPGEILWYIDVYMPKCFRTPEKIVVQDIVILSNGMLIRCSKDITLMPNSIGTVAFRTREEALEVL